jgi:O-antigen/teichoic acid export membrane protein
MQPFIDRELGEKAFISGIQAGLGGYGTQIARFLGAIALTRLLEPSDFGVAALASFLYGAYSTFRELGLGSGLYHYQGNSDEVVATHFTLYCFLSVFVCIVVFLSSSLVTFFFGEKVTNFLFLLALIGLVDGVTQTQRILLEKSFRFGYITAIDFFSFVISIGLAIFAAGQGFGYWALGIQYGVESVVKAIATWVARPWRKARLLIHAKSIKWYYVNFVKILYIRETLCWVLNNVDNFIVGAVLGMRSLGFYERAQVFARIPMSITANVAEKVSWVTYAKLQNNRDQLRKAQEIVMGAIAFLACAVSGIIVINADEVVSMLYGGMWNEHVPSILTFFSVLMIAKPLNGNAEVFLISQGLNKDLLMASIPRFLSSVVVTLGLAVLYGTIGAAIGIGLSYTVGVYSTSRAIQKNRNFNILPAIRNSLVLYAVLMVLFFVSGKLFRLESIHLSFLLKSSVFGFIFLGILYLLQKDTFRSYYQLLKRSIGSRPE